MKNIPLYIPNYAIQSVKWSLYIMMLQEVAWENAGAPRMECFMSAEPMQYGYDTRMGTRYYNSIPYHPAVLALQDKLNKEYGTQYNVCFLNYYSDEKQHLGWHADDSPGMDLNHPIAVISFGQERYIYTKEKEFKGKIPDSDKYLLGDCSLFIMPAGFQKDHYHKIPKGDREMKGRISLTFRHYMP